jgi:hypothetical protein
MRQKNKQKHHNLRLLVFAQDQLQPPRKQLFNGIQIGSQLVSLDSEIDGGFARNDPLRRDSAAVDPHRNCGLPDSLARSFGELRSKGDLASGRINKSLDWFTHDREDNTHGVISAITRSGIFRRHNLDVPKQSKSTDFWMRLSQASAACQPPISMRQKDLAAECKVYQSAVTKWKTGGDDGKTKPRPAIIEALAKKRNVTFEWLNSGQGQMRPVEGVDRVTQLILDALRPLNEQSKREVLIAAYGQQQLQNPVIAAQLKEAQRDADKVISAVSQKRKAAAD